MLRVQGVALRAMSSEPKAVGVQQVYTKIDAFAEDERPCLPLMHEPSLQKPSMLDLQNMSKHKLC